MPQTAVGVGPTSRPVTASKSNRAPTTQPQRADRPATSNVTIAGPATQPALPSPPVSPSPAKVTPSTLINASATTPSTKPTSLASFAEPSISPDGSEIAFVSGGDIWTVPIAGGEARLLISHPNNESRPRYSPDGRKLAFVSNRTGNGDIYVFSFDTGELKRLTFDDGREELDSWSRDGKWIYFSTTAHDPGGMPDIYRVSADGGTPMPVIADKYAAEYGASASPDGTRLVFSAGGNGGRNWFRQGHDHSDECDIWLMTESPNGTEPPVFFRLTEGDDKNLWPLWSRDGKTVFYVSDHGGMQNIWQRATSRRSGGGRQVTQFKDGRVLYPDITPDGSTIVFERNFGIWKLDTATGDVEEVRIRLRGAPAVPSIERINFGNSVSELTLSPDGKKMAIIAHGQVFAGSARDGGEGVRITHSPATESHVVWSRDSRRLAYISDRDGPRHLFLYDFSTGREYRLTRGTGDDTSPSFASDDLRIAFQRDGKELRLIEITTRNETLLAGGQSFERAPFDRSPSPYAWSPKGEWIAYISQGAKGFDNVYCVATSGPTTRPLDGTWPFRGKDGQPAPHQITFLANAGSNAVSWSPDGTFLLFGTGQRTEEYQMARIDLVPRTPRFREDLFRDLFRDVPRTTFPGRRNPLTLVEPRVPSPTTAPAITGPSLPSLFNAPATQESNIQIVFDHIRQRLTLLPINADVGYHTISPDGKMVLFTATSAGQQNLYIFPLDDSIRDAAPRQLTSTSGYKHNAQFSPDGKEVYYLDGGRINAVPLDTRVPRSIPVVADMDVDFATEKKEVFHQAWQYLNDNFFDPNFNGVDWIGMRETYKPRVNGARTPDELRRILSMMVGELNSSHVGVYGQANGKLSGGRLGLAFDRREYEQSGRLRVTEVVPLGPAAVGGINVGDLVVGVDRTLMGNRINLDEMLDQKIGRRVTLVVTDRNGKRARDAALLAIDYNTERTLMYRSWVESRRQYIDRISGGRLGYVHIPDMTETALARLNTDLDSENQTRDGIVIDIRNNRGGFVNGFAIDVFARRNYLTMTRRGYPPVPSRTLLGQRAIGVPSVLVTNRFTISDAEDFTEGFRFLNLGKVIGEPTAGAVVFTSTVSLIDGTLFRIPETLVTANDGVPLEMHPRPVDIAVSRPVGEGYGDHDAQLDAAVSELLNRIATDARQAAPAAARVAPSP